MVADSAHFAALLTAHTPSPPTAVIFATSVSSLRGLRGERVAVLCCPQQVPHPPRNLGHQQQARERRRQVQHPLPERRIGDLEDDLAAWVDDDPVHDPTQATGS